MPESGPEESITVSFCSYNVLALAQTLCLITLTARIVLNLNHDFIMGGQLWLRA